MGSSESGQCIYACSHSSSPTIPTCLGSLQPHEGKHTCQLTWCTLRGVISDSRQGEESLTLGCALIRAPQPLSVLPSPRLCSLAPICASRPSFVLPSPSFVLAGPLISGSPALVCTPQPFFMLAGLLPMLPEPSFVVSCPCSPPCLSFLSPSTSLNLQLTPFCCSF